MSGIALRIMTVDMSLCPCDKRCLHKDNKAPVFIKMTFFVTVALFFNPGSSVVFCLLQWHGSRPCYRYRACTKDAKRDTDASGPNIIIVTIIALSRLFTFNCKA